MAEAEIVNIAPDGDVVFVCTRHPKTDQAISVRIRVASSFVGNASPVLRAMLSPKFKEGISLATSGYVEVALPDDDPDAMIILLNAFHLRYLALPSSLNIGTLQAVGVIVDKYDCGEAVAPLAYGWIHKQLEAPDAEQLHELLGAAYRFRQADMFDEVGRMLVYHSKDSVAKDTGELALVLNALEIRRQSAILNLNLFLQGTMNVPCRRKPCKADTDVGNRILAALKGAGLWQAPGTEWKRSLDTASRALRMHHFGTAVSNAETCGHTDCPAYIIGKGDTVLDQQIDRYLATIESSLPRLCLVCVKTGAGIFKREDCTEHS